MPGCLLRSLKISDNAATFYLCIFIQCVMNDELQTVSSATKMLHISNSQCSCHISSIISDSNLFEILNYFITSDNLLQIFDAKWSYSMGDAANAILSRLLPFTKWAVKLKRDTCWEGLDHISVVDESHLALSTIPWIFDLTISYICKIFFL